MQRVWHRIYWLHVPEAGKWSGPQRDWCFWTSCRVSLYFSCEIFIIFAYFPCSNKNRQRFEAALHTLDVAKTRYYVSWAGILLGIAATVIGAVLYSIKNPTWQYGIVADGGSSHTSFILFNWPENYQTGIDQITECSVQEGGIDQVWALGCSRMSVNLLM